LFVQRLREWSGMLRRDKFSDAPAFHLLGLATGACELSSPKINNSSV
jgi:hypothetical protein